MCPPGCGQRGPWRPPRISSLAETSREPQVAVMTAKHRRVPRDRVAGAPRHSQPGTHDPGRLSQGWPSVSVTRQDPLAPTAAVLRRFITSRPNSAGGTWRPPRAPRGENRLVLAIARWCGHGPDAQLSHRSARTARAEPVPVGSTGPNERNGNDGPHSGPPCHVQVPPGAAAWAPCCGPRPAHPRPPAPAPAPQGAWLCLHGRWGGDQNAGSRSHCSLSPGGGTLATRRVS